MSSGSPTTINGVDTSVTPFVTSRPVTSIVANLNAGNDFIQLSSTVGGGLAVSSGAGSDLIQVILSSVGLNAVIDAGAGDDQVGASGLSVRSNLSVFLGAGNDGLTLINVNAFAALLYGGTGTNTLTINAPSRSGIRTLRYYQFQTVTNV